tara:strand:- start:5663 stop:5938 length:276 start_codon:yes stop_codon:yes gene_type:complete
MSDEFTIDIDKALENAKTNDLAGGFKDTKPGALESVRKSVDNCVMMAGLDKRVMEELLKGEWSEFTTSNSTGRQSKKIVIEYEIKQKEDDT